MSIAALEIAITTRGTGDTGTGGLFATGSPLVNHFGFDTLPSAANMPMVGASWAAVPANHGFDVDVFQPELRLRAYVARVGSATPKQRLSDITERLLTRFHRWKPTLSGSSYTVNGGLFCFDQQPEHDDVSYSVILSFRCTMSKSA